LARAACRSNLLPIERQFFVYILTNRWHTVLYTGVTSDLPRRIAEHRAKATAATAQF